MDETAGGRRPLAAALRRSWLDFLTHTSTHGARYIGEDDRTLFERLFWIIVIFAGLGTSGFMVMNIYNRYTESPTVTTLEHTHYPTWRLPFPAITVCNNNRVQRTRAEDLIQKLSFSDYMNESMLLDGLRTLVLLNNPEIVPKGDFADVQDVLDMNGLSIPEVMEQLSQPCQEMLERCSWQSEIVNCMDMFEMRKSHLGYCCSFNYVGDKDFTKSTGGPGPLHSRLYGQRMGLTVLINPAVDDYFVSSFISSGIAVHIHDPYVFPDEHIIMKMVPVNKEVLVPIRISSRTCSKEVKDMSISVRDCLLPTENHLQFFPRYLDDNCVTECKMNYSLRICSCLPYFYPTDGEHRICDLMDASCLNDNFELLHTFKPGVVSEHKSIVEEHDAYLKMAESAEKAMVCNCPTQCEGVSYEARVSWGDFAASLDSVNQLFGPETNDTNRILLHLFLESNFSQVTKRGVATSKSVLLGLLGGICSLFLGCSFVTPLEFTYFFTVRLPGFFRNDIPDGDPCPASPRTVRDIPEVEHVRDVQENRNVRFPSVRSQNNTARLIFVSGKTEKE